MRVPAFNGKFLQANDSLGLHIPGLAATEAILQVYGAQGRDRTTDTAIFSRMLYQLSYLGVPRKAS